MAEDPVKEWGRLFARATRVLDAAQAAARSALPWSFGGGSALMRRHRHRRSVGVDIFLHDAYMLEWLSPRPNAALGAHSVNYVEEPGAVRLWFPEGEVAFIACGLLTSDPLREEIIQGRRVLVETSAEILAKKLWHRAARFAARDLFDFAIVARREPGSLGLLRGILRIRGDALLGSLREREAALREDFAALDALDFRATYGECVATLQQALADRPPSRRLEQTRAGYEVLRGPVVPGGQRLGTLTPCRRRSAASALLRAQGASKRTASKSASFGAKASNELPARKRWIFSALSMRSSR